MGAGTTWKVLMRLEEKKFPSWTILLFNPASRIIVMTDTQLYSFAISMKSSFAHDVWNLWAWSLVQSVLKHRRQIYLRTLEILFIASYVVDYAYSDFSLDYFDVSFFLVVPTSTEYTCQIDCPLFLHKFRNAPVLRNGRISQLEDKFLYWIRRCVPMRYSLEK